MVNIQIFLIKIVLFIFQSVPERYSLKFGEYLGLFWFKVIRYRRKLVLDNLKQAFKNEKTDAELLEIAKKNFIHYGISFAEFLRFPLYKPETLLSKGSYVGINNIREALKKNKGLIIICGHYGNWDLMSIYQALLGVDAYIITKRAKNETIDNFWQKIREEKGVKFLSSKNSIFDIIKLLNENNTIVLIFDQHMPGRMGIKVNFFDRSCCTMKSVAFLALKTGCSVIPVFGHRDENNHHHFEIDTEIPLVIGENEDDTILKSTQNYNDILEAFIRKHPEQWLWIHRRWK
jgi:Kdo2-lipid IVA lauroyltransferase/acyltransferase